MENPTPLGTKDTNSKIQAVSKLKSNQSGSNKRSRVEESTASVTTVKKTRMSSERTGSRTSTSRRASLSSRTSTRKPVKPRVSRTTTTRTMANKTAVSRSRPGVTKPAATSGRVASTRPGAVSKARTTTGTTAAAPNAGAKKTKRPAWDLKGRVADMENALKNNSNKKNALKELIEGNNERIQQLENQNSQLKGTVAQTEEQKSEASQTIRELKRKLEESEDALASSTRRLQQQIEDEEQKYTTLKRKHTTLEGDYDALTQECAGLKSTVAQMTSAQAGMKAQVSATELNLEQVLDAGRLKDEEIKLLKETIARHEATIEVNEAKIREDESVRRKLHNTIQELKGNIRVFCRVRPLLGEEFVHGEEIEHLNFPDDDHKVLEMDKLAELSMNESALNSTRNGTKKYEFQFDRVFTPASKQQDIFDEISQLVQSSLDGYNVCIFAYGQTGSGKTYTMEGPDNPDDDTMGMIPRAVHQVFDTAQDLKDKGWEYEMEASFVEIYNECIRDLLGSASNKDLKHEIKLVDPKNKKKTNDVEVTNLERPIVTSQSQVAGLLKKASHNRAVAATNCNERSSRSHSVFRLKLIGSNKLTGENCTGSLNLVDLAGSERLSQSGSTGDRLRETKCINSSLSNLGQVIMALANKDKHIPYRNSKLTYMLQDSLGGNSKTLMFVNISPKEENFNESLCSLRFATKVNQCNIGTAQKKVK